jgi:hypothetical protein
MDNLPMKDHFVPVRREWSYAAFIDELKPLIDQVKHFQPSDRRHDSQAFKTWQHKVSSLCSRIDRSHVDSTCGLDHRQFRVMSYGTKTSLQEMTAFDRDMRDTITELEHIVQQYEKYGEPMMKNTAAARAMKPADVVAQASRAQEPVLVKPPEVEWPSHLTMKWLWEHMPASAYAWVGGLVCAAFLGGIAVGGWPVFQKWLEPTPAATPAKSVKP